MKFQKVNFEIEMTRELYSFLITSNQVIFQRNKNKIKSNLLNVNIKGTTETRSLSTQIQSFVFIQHAKSKILYTISNSKTINRQSANLKFREIGKVCLGTGMVFLRNF